jgi:hypothetical protein
MIPRILQPIIGGGKREIGLTESKSWSNMSAKKPLQAGRGGSKKNGPSWVPEIKTPQPELTKLLGKVYDSMRRDERKSVDRETYQRLRFDFVFHMTDWLNDIHRINDLYSHPERFSTHDATTQVIAILVHVIPHLNAAGRLLLDEVSDPFADMYQPEIEKKTPKGHPALKAKIKAS